MIGRNVVKKKKINEISIIFVDSSLKRLLDFNLNQKNKGMNKNKKRLYINLKLG